MRLSKNVFGYLTQLPTLFFLILIVLFPLAYAFDISLRSYVLTQPGMFPYIGLQNYQDLIENSMFIRSWTNTFTFTAGTVSLTLLTALVIALILNEKFRFRGLCRALLLIPWAMPTIVSGITWKWIYSGAYGVLNYILQSLGLISKYIVWTGSKQTAMLSVVIAKSWTEVPFAALLMLAGLQTIPVELYEAAKVGGANIWQRFRYITLPLMRNIITVVLVLTTMNALKVFDLIYALTQGGPGGVTTVVSWWAYQLTFHTYDFGRGSALSYLIALCILVFSLVYFRLVRRRRE